MGGRVSTILKYNALKEDEVNLCDMQESSGYRDTGNSNTLHNLRYFCASFRVRLHPHIVIGCAVGLVLVLIITLTAVYHGDGNRSKNPLSKANETCAFDLSLPIDYHSKPYKRNDFEVDQNTSTEISSSMNTEIDPCDNFYEFACQGWPQKYPRPQNTSYWTVFKYLSEQTDKIVTELMETPALEKDIPAYKLAQNFYKSCVQVEEEDNERDKLLLNFVWNTLEKYGGWPMLYENGTWDSKHFNWKKSMTALAKQFKTTTILDIFSFQDSNGALSNNSIVITAPSPLARRRDNSRLGSFMGIDNLGASDNLTSSKDQAEFIVNAAKLLLKFKGQDNFDHEALEQQANAIVDMQGDLALASLAGTLASKASGLLILLGLKEKDDTKTTLGELQEKIDGALDADNTVQFKEILDLLYAPAGVEIADNENLTVVDTTYVLEILKYVQTADLQTLANFLHYKMLVYMMPMLTKDFRELMANRQRDLDASRHPPARREICAEDVEESFRFAVGQKFVEREFKNTCEFNDVVIQMQQMFHHIKDVLNEHRDSLNSFLEESKLVSFINSTEICVGFPDWLFDGVKVQKQYLGLQLENMTTYLEQSLTTNDWVLNNQLKKLRVAKIVGECEWNWFAGEVGAFTYMEQFKLYFPLGILQKPFLRRDQSLALNYGAIGSVIGHELTHAFARFGWEKTENNTLTTGASCLEDQYSQFSLRDAFPNQTISQSDNLFLSGSQTVDENFADNGGIALAYRAFKLEESKGYGESHTQGSPLSSIGQRRYSSDQLFFIAFAQNFCGSSTVRGMKDNMQLDVHSPGFFRVLGTLQNSEEFVKAWNCSVGSKMNPDYEKCSLLEEEDNDDYPN